MASSILSSIMNLTAKLLAFAPSPSPLKPDSSSSSSLVTPSFAKKTSMIQEIQTVIVDAERKGVKDESIKLWLLELKQVSYDAEDILGDFEFELLRSKMEADRKRKREVFEYDPSSPLYDANLQNKMLQRIRMVCEMFDEIEKDRVRFHLVEQDGELKSRTKIRSPTSSLAYQSEVIGRDVEKNEIINALMAPLGDDKISASAAHVVCVVGMGGLGKTTLAKLVYNDERIINQFNLRVWKWVFEAHGAVGLLKATVEAFTGQTYHNVTDVAQLQYMLSHIVAGKRFLLVLDDVWNDDLMTWESLRAPLENGLKGSCIFITTRSRKVSDIMDAEVTLELNPLRRSESWALFCRHAFEVDATEALPSLIEKGQAIVEKCKGVPLAIKVLGGLLCFEDEETWEDVQRSELWNLDEGKDNILSSLILSYLYLPASLKPCFTYCSVIPKGCFFKQETMVRMWMAQGLIQTEDNKQMEGTGRSFFNELRRRSLVQDAIPDFFMMHDLIHDSARSIWEKECCNATYEELQGMLECGNTVRHLSVMMANDISSFGSIRVSGMLRSLLLAARYPINLNVMTEMFLRLRVTYLRVLDLSSTGIDELPDSIGGLKHLRYLSPHCN
ncbi:putative disease resistance protein RGA3 [Dioscorea cayenensis subsp. rotundata]|uniref:Disease resistance protein RGA3 n=1 Tax=Dioscorea cayennensis subsp. rotundata TaxID=55577 RepID=A0AB40C7C9_DIOCR|nr:putative disease resistance protein RGA3 [Dioscorea cayenensis subsp. rotundata]